MEYEYSAIDGLHPNIIDRILFLTYVKDRKTGSILNFLLTCREAYHTHLHVLYRLKEVSVEYSRFHKKNCHVLERKGLPVCYLNIKNINDKTPLHNISLMDILHTITCGLGFTSKPEVLWSKLLLALPANVTHLNINVNGNYPLPVSADNLFIHNRPWLPLLTYFSFWCKGKPIVRQSKKGERPLIFRSRKYQPKRAQLFSKYMFVLLQSMQNNLKYLVFGNVESEVLGFLNGGWKTLDKFPQLEWIILTRNIDFKAKRRFIRSLVLYRLVIYDSFNHEIILYESEAYTRGIFNPSAVHRARQLVKQAMRIGRTKIPMKEMKLVYYLHRNPVSLTSETETEAEAEEEDEEEDDEDDYEEGNEV